jgi:branched-chain amino acid transport system substrate-binding protein
MRGKQVVRLTVLCCLFLAVSVFALSGAYGAEKKEIVIGSSICLTGPQAAPGADLKWSYEQAVADVNKAGGIFVKEYGKKLPVRLVIADDEGDAGKAAAAVEKLIKVEKVDLLLGTHSTPLVISNCITAEKYKKYLHGTACIIPPWAEQKFQWSTLFFFDLMTFSDVPFKVMKTLPASDKVERPALLMDDTPDGKAMGPLFRMSAEKAGYKFAVDEEWSAGAKDYSSQILRMKEKNVDAIIIIGTSADLITFVRQMKENKFGVKYFHGYKGTWEGEFAKALGKDADYVLADGFWSESYPYPKAAELGKRYFEKFQKRSVSVGLWYATAQTLFQAIENAGTLDSAKVRAAVVNHEFKGTPMGDVKYGPEGTAMFDQPAFQWIGGQLKLVYPQVKGAATAQAAPAWDKR